MVMIASNGFWLGTVLLFNWVQWMVMAVADSLSTPAPFYGIKRSELLQERINTECNDCIPRWPSGYVSYILMHMIKRWDIFTWNREKNEMNGLDSWSTAYWICTVLIDGKLTGFRLWSTEMKADTHNDCLLDWGLEKGTQYAQ